MNLFFANLSPIVKSIPENNNNYFQESQKRIDTLAKVYLKEEKSFLSETEKKTDLNSIYISNKKSLKHHKNLEESFLSKFSFQRQKKITKNKNKNHKKMKKTIGNFSVSENKIKTSKNFGSFLTKKNFKDDKKSLNLSISFYKENGWHNEEPKNLSFSFLGFDC